MSVTNRQIAFGGEGLWGVPAMPTHGADVISFSVKRSHKTKLITTIRQLANVGMVYGGYVVEGEIVLAANYEDIHFFAEYLMGNIATTGAGPYVHTAPDPALGIGNRINQSLTIEALMDPGIVFTFSGCMIESWKHNWTEGDIATITLGFVGKTFEDIGDTETTITFADFYELQPIQSFITVAGTELPAKSLSVEIKRPVTRPSTMRTLGLYSQPRAGANMEVSYGANVIFDDASEADWFGSIDGTTQKAIEIQSRNAESGETKYVKYTSANCRIAGDDPSFNLFDELVADMKAFALFNSTATGNLVIATKNAQAT